MTSDFHDTTVLLTGASRGLGRAMALSLASQGASLALCATSEGDALSGAAEDCLEAGARAVSTHAFDIADPDACAAAVDAAEEQLGPITALVNNAGLGMRRISETFNTVPTKFWEADARDWADIIATNVNGSFNMARAVVPAMVERGYGKVINISTSDQTMVRRGYSPYGPSKAALEAASRVWAQDLDGTGVTVNVFLPGGAADTDLLPPSPDKKGADGNLLSPEVMATGILWLCGSGSDGVTGGRYIGRFWGDEDAPAPAACSPHVDRPSIM
ncbi:SDR family oxidoreductase [Celeribacter litoreus]|uniref:SDR family oxidoreductase n=1 Tax=Celeribacter litoreus TaxID=2876714 RepID=UPI001CCFB24C|nr:SDR family oxidoreductase [Celeribacter litoreus]MCA0042527.1 SDR family oxidoreductase [Celeribacter litoreus]